MSGEYTLIRDIVCNHNERMLNIKRYYPFFKISEISFSTYKDGKFDILDMGYIMMAVLRFFIEENNFHEKPVTYNEYADFMHEVFVRDFELTIDKDEEKELVSYIFDKLKNDGKPFSYEYFDPESKKKKTVRTKLIDNKILEDKVLYFITADAIAFYLDTKEIKDESNITINQVLLTKMISTRNFRGGTEVLVRINNEVSRLISRKNEILNVLSYDVFAGIKLYEEFMENTVKWFEEEQKLFEKNKELVNKALKSCESDSGYYSAMEDIYHLEKELNRAMNKHSELLDACMGLQAKTDELVISAKLNSLRSTFDFRKVLSELISSGDINSLELIVKPLLKLRTKKTFSFHMLDNMLTYRTEDKEIGEKIKNPDFEENFKYPDELEEDRIFKNYGIILKTIMDMLVKENEAPARNLESSDGNSYYSDMSKFTLTDLNNELIKRCGENAIKNVDYYSFLVHLCQKNVYEIDKTLEKPDTFLEEIICRNFEENEEEYKKFRYLSFELKFNKEVIKIGENEIAEIIFERKFYGR